MGNRHDRAGKALEKLFEPLNALGIEVVRRLVEQQHVGLGDQQAAECNAALLTAGKRSDLCIPRWQAQRVGCNLELLIEIVARGLQNRFEFRLLLGELLEVGVRIAVLRVEFLEPLARREQLA